MDDDAVCYEIFHMEIIYLTIEIIKKIYVSGILQSFERNRKRYMCVLDDNISLLPPCYRDESISTSFLYAKSPGPFET